MSRPRKRRATPLLIVLWWVWAISAAIGEFFGWLQRRTRQWRLVSNLPVETRTYRMLGYLALPARYTRALAAKWAGACPVCFAANYCPWHWALVHAEPFLTHSQRRARQRLQGISWGKGRSSTPVEP